MKIATIYRSRYGSTKQYAEWIHERVGGVLLSAEEAKKVDLASFDVLIFGGFFHAGRVSIRKLLVKNWPLLQGKHVVLFSTSGTPPGEPEVQEVYEASFPQEIRDRLAYFPLLGRMNQAQWGLSDKALMHVAKFFVRDPEFREGMFTDVDGRFLLSLSLLRLLVWFVVTVVALASCIG